MEMQQYVASAIFMEPRNPFQNATRLLPNATERTFCCVGTRHRASTHMSG
jgi:hypothetical protein